MYRQSVTWLGSGRDVVLQELELELTVIQLYSKKTRQVANVWRYIILVTIHLNNILVIPGAANPDLCF
jgi:hypothetical protein